MKCVPVCRVPHVPFLGALHQWSYLDIFVKHEIFHFKCLGLDESVPHPRTVPKYLFWVTGGLIKVRQSGSHSNFLLSLNVNWLQSTEGIFSFCLPLPSSPAFHLPQIKEMLLKLLHEIYDTKNSVWTKEGPPAVCNGMAVQHFLPGEQIISMISAFLSSPLCVCIFTLTSSLQIYPALYLISD